MSNNWMNAGMNQGYNNILSNNMWGHMRPQLQNYNLPHYDAPLLNGEQDANNFLMGPNSEIYLPDANQDIMWWIRTDATCNKTVIPLDVKLHQKQAPVDLNAIEARLATLEEQVNAKFNKSNASRRNNNANANATNESSVVG